MSPSRSTDAAYAGLVAARFGWAGWDALITRNGFTIDRPHRSVHPSFPEVVYPIDYGYVNGTRSSDGEEVDVFVGTHAGGGLVGTALTRDRRRGKREFKLLYRCTPEEVYLVHGFLNFAPALLEARLVLRQPMQTLWQRTRPA